MALLNSALSAEWAGAFAARVLQQAGPDVSRQVQVAYRLAYSREPDAWEEHASLAFLDRHSQIIASEKAAKNIDAPSVVAEEDVPAHHVVALVDFCLMLLNSNEFVFRF